MKGEVWRGQNSIKFLSKELGIDIKSVHELLTRDISNYYLKIY